MWMKPVPDGDMTPIVTPRADLGGPRASPRPARIVLGVLPGLVMRFADLKDLSGALGG